MTSHFLSALSTHLPQNDKLKKLKIQQKDPGNLNVVGFAEVGKR